MAHQTSGNTAFVTSFSPQKPDIKDPPVVEKEEEEREPQSLEEALLGAVSYTHLPLPTNPYV